MPPPGEPGAAGLSRSPVLVARAAATLDLTRPVAVMRLGILNFGTARWP